MGLMNVLVLFMAILFTANGQGKRRIHANALVYSSEGTLGSNSISSSPHRVQS